MTTVTLNPSASNHDGYEDAGGSVDTTNNVIRVDENYWAGLYAPSSIPAGSTINSATLYFVPSTTAYDDVNATWYAEDVDTAAVFTTTSSSISSRTRTTASLSHTGTGIKDGTTPIPFTVTSIVQEVVSRGGFTGPIVLLANGHAGSVLRIRPYDNGSSIWYLDVNYTEPAATATAGRLVGRIPLTSKVGGILA